MVTNIFACPKYCCNSDQLERKNWISGNYPIFTFLLKDDSELDAACLHSTV